MDYIHRPIIDPTMGNTLNNHRFHKSDQHINQNNQKPRVIFILVVCHIVSFSYLFWYIHGLERSIEPLLKSSLEKESTLKVKRALIPPTKIDNESAKTTLLVGDKFQNDRQEFNMTLLEGEKQIYSSAAANSSENWIWLNEFSRIPVTTVKQLCTTTRQYCPPSEKGAQGAPGRSGVKGDRGEKGDRGNDGTIGPRGIQGLPGPRGPPGIKGDIGYEGLDGTNGLPGEPGLDGVPGRSGRDGIPGKDGTPGRDGTPGLPGRDGNDGIPGAKGEQGPPGTPGATGLPGPRGRSGKPGIDGIPGIPGVQILNDTSNGTTRLLQQPSIIGSENTYMIRDIVVHENDNIKLKCSATGVPEPEIVWRQIKNKVLAPVYRNGWGEINLNHPVLEFPKIGRTDMGEYMCIASNGLPPSANQTFNLLVQFSPYIVIANPIVNVTLGKSANLECMVEAYPRGVYYWTKVITGDIIDQDSSKYKFSFHHITSYQTRMQLNISNVTEKDLGLYSCTCKNDEDSTTGYVNITTDLNLDQLPNYYLRIPESRKDTYGTKAPDRVGKLCSDCPPCKICGFGYRDLEIRKLGNSSYPRLRNRVLDCEMETIGKPVYHNFINESLGSWMRDPAAKGDDLEKIWLTLHNDTSHLYEYPNKISFANKRDARIHNLSDPFMGTENVVYNGSFYYNKKDSSIIIRHVIDQRMSYKFHLPYGNTSSSTLLYKSKNNYADISADDNGLWVIYGISDSNNTAVIKLNTSKNNLQIEHALNISVKHRDQGDMFIICGILYAVDSVTEFDTKISLALDLYKESLLDDIQIRFTNPFKNTTMIKYNYYYKELFTWDAGNMLTYPIRYHLLTDKSSNETREDFDTSESETSVERGRSK